LLYSFAVGAQDARGLVLGRFILDFLLSVLVGVVGSYFFLIFTFGP